MEIWIGVLAVGVLSLAFRLGPVLTVARVGLRPRTTGILRHAGAGAIAALVAIAVLRPDGAGVLDWPVVLAVLVGGLLAWRGRSTLWAVLAGGGVFALATALGALV
jgi:branched-subunit amino acid transport protein